MSILLSVAAQFLLRAGASASTFKALDDGETKIADILLRVLSNQYTIFGLLIYATGAVLWLGVLSKWEVSKAYPLVGLGFALSTLIGFVLGEQIGTARLLGVALICAGVALVGHS